MMASRRWRDWVPPSRKAEEPLPAEPQIEELPVEDVFDMGLTGIDKTFLEQFGIRVRENG